MIWHNLVLPLKTSPFLPFLDTHTQVKMKLLWQACWFFLFCKNNIPFLLINRTLILCEKPTICDFRKGRPCSLTDWWAKALTHPSYELVDRLEDENVIDSGMKDDSGLEKADSSRVLPVGASWKDLSPELLSLGCEPNITDWPSYQRCVRICPKDRETKFWQHHYIPDVAMTDPPTYKNKHIQRFSSYFSWVCHTELT